jgi:hypothetical protein
MPNIDRDDEHATRYEMTDTKPTLDEQITKIRILVEAYEYGNVDAGMFLGILASLERLKQIDAAEMPVEPDGLHGSMVDAYQLTKIHQYAVALQAYAQRKEAELSDAVHLNDEQAQRVYKAERERDALRALLGGIQETYAIVLSPECIVAIDNAMDAGRDTK